MEPSANKKEDDFFSKQVSEKEKRKLKARHENSGSVWSGLGMFGMVGWSVAVPTLLGTALGIWLDKIYHQSFSWTLTCLISGLFLGCLIAWRWVSGNDKDEEDE
jgi:ATP synthase protein I